MSNQAERQIQRSSGRAWSARVVVCLWAMFVAGLLIQLAAPRLKIENNAFAMPPIVNAQGAAIRPDVLVRRERWMQGASGILTVGGALALGICYRRTLAAALMGSRGELSAR